MVVNTDDYNIDSTALMGIFGMLSGLNNLNWNKTGVLDTDVSLTTYELNYLFRRNKLIKKIIIKYPNEAKTVGYQIKDSKGRIIAENDELILEAFHDASIYARIYGKSYLVFDTEKKDFEKPLKIGEKLTGFKVKHILNKFNDYYLTGSERIHESYVLIFIGEKNYNFEVDINNEDYSDSIIQSLYESFFNYINSSKYVKYIMENISYLRIGIKSLGTKLRNEAGKKEIFERLQSVNANRDASRLLTYDIENETIDFISQSLAGIPEVVKEFKDLLVCESDYPYDILFEDSQNNGLSSGAQNQLIIRVLWAKKVKNWVENNWLKNYKTLFSRLYKEFQNNSTYTIEIPFNVETTQEEQANLENNIADRNKKLIETGIITVKEARTTYRDNKFNLNLELDEKAFEKEQQSKLEGGQPEEKQTEETTQDGKKLSDLNFDELSDEEYDELASVTFDDIEELDLDAKRAPRKTGYVRDRFGKFARVAEKGGGKTDLQPLDIVSQQSMLKSGKIGSATTKNELNLIATTLGINIPPKAKKEDIKELIRSNPAGKDFFTTSKTATETFKTPKTSETPKAKEQPKVKEQPKAKESSKIKTITSTTKKAELEEIATTLGINIPPKAKKDDIKELIKNSPNGKDFFPIPKSQKTSSKTEKEKKISDNKPESKSVTETVQTKPTIKSLKIDLNNETFESLLEKVDSDNDDFRVYQKLGELFSEKHLKIDETVKKFKQENKEFLDNGEKIADNYNLIKQNLGLKIKVDGRNVKVTKKMLDEARSEYMKMKEDVKKIEEVMEKQIQKQHYNLKQNILSIHNISREDARKEILKRVDISRINKAEAKITLDGLEEAYILSGGKGVGTLKQLVNTKPRASASFYERSINIGNTTAKEKYVIMHEFAHHYEYESPGIMKAANEWRNNKAEDMIPKKLSELTGVSSYGEKEVALKDKYLRPYVGKVYFNRNTIFEGREPGILPSEVVSMGTQFFVTSGEMKKLYDMDKEHYNFTVGVLLAKRKKTRYDEEKLSDIF